ncbi:MAG: peptidylprolyl isomerase [Krumholzibacteria bacterium]|nr:peptidylprolyl isomerase [Candidatus Krumholzibacteria bacterium]
MFKLLRSKAKVFYWVIAGSFFLFLGLGGLTGRGCQPPGTNPYESGVVGAVNGRTIAAQDYDFTVRQQTALMRQQTPGGDLNANQYAAARERAWDEMVRNALVEQAIAARKIKASDAEVLDAFQNNPPMELLDAYRDENGAIDLERYFADLQNPEADWSRAEQYVREVYLPRMKLMEEISAAVTVTDEEVREEYVRQTGRAVAEYMGLAYAALDDGFEPADTDLQAWYDAHPQDYARPARARVQVVRFAKEASDADYEEVRVFLDEIRQEIVSGQKDFAVAAAEYSEDGTARNGGDLGTFDRNRMVEPFTEAAFSLPVGEISAPVRTRFGYHLIEVLSRETDKDTGEVYQVHARHILLKVTPGPATMDLLREAAEAFRARVDGGSFASTAQAEAMDLVEPESFVPERDIPGLAMTLAGGNWSFAAKAGAVSPVFENEQFMYVVHKVEELPAGPAPLEEVRGQVALAVRQDHNRTAVRARLAPAVGEVQMGTAMAVAAANHGLAHAVTDTFTVNANVADIGYGTAFNAAAINGELGRLVPEVETPRGLYALVPLWIEPFDEAAFAARREGIRGALLQNRKALVVEEWLDAQKQAAKVEDYRADLGMGV